MDLWLNDTERTLTTPTTFFFSIIGYTHTHTHQKKCMPSILQTFKAWIEVSRNVKLFNLYENVVFINTKPICGRQNSNTDSAVALLPICVHALYNPFLLSVCRICKYDEISLLDYLVSQRWRDFAYVIKVLNILSLS